MRLSKSLKSTAKKDIKLAGELIQLGLKNNDIKILDVSLSAFIEGLGVLKSLEKQKRADPKYYLMKKGEG